VRSLDGLAPKFAAAVRAAIADANAAGLDAIVFESRRSRELAELYYARGRTVKPPERTVTNAPDETYSWHGYGLAVDVISLRHQWDKPPEWFAAVFAHFKRHGCRWGGEWKRKDFPHFQWGRCKPSPSPRARTLLASEGILTIWREVGAAT
jgi:peptidoglycan L-alanyl-D-glutamate endopeptidase CwlK